MLTEHFVASISAPTKPNTSAAKDAGIFLHEFQPLAAQRHVFKKSCTPTGCLAVSRSHAFAAQEGKAVVHVYSREKGNQEAIVAFPERIHSIALAAKDTVLLLGTDSGRVLAWEVCSGRLVSTATSHLQPVTSLAVDPSSTFVLSASSDAIIHVWPLAAILSFSPDTSRNPIHTLSTHRGPITALVCGHSSSDFNIAISISQDKTAIVWEFHNGRALRTYLLPDTPVAIALDAADRAFYVAYEDGSLQTIDFFSSKSERDSPVDTLREAASSHRPIQPSARTRFDAESQKLGGALSLSLSWDGSTLISGHVTGKIASWDIAKSNYMSTLVSLPGPVTNLFFLEPIGFPDTPSSNFKISTVTKPKQDVGAAHGRDGSELVPSNYSLNMQFAERIHIPSLSATEVKRLDRNESQFQTALTHTIFPSAMLEKSLAEVQSWGAHNQSGHVPASDFVALDQDGEDTSPGHFNVAQETEMNELKKQLASLQRVQKVTFSQLSELRDENDHFFKKEENRRRRKSKKAKDRLSTVNGSTGSNADKDVEMGEDRPRPESVNSITDDDSSSD